MRLDARYPARLALLTAGVVAASVALTGPAMAVAPLGSTVFINEIHYDNTGTDAGETIEIAAPAGTDLAGWSLVLYNGNGGAVYDTKPLSGIVPGLPETFGIVSVATVGIQNGGPDGVALVGPIGVEQFLSYEGSFAGVGGPAGGLVSTDIGVAESDTTPAGNSLALTGNGSTYGAFAWQPAAPPALARSTPVNPSVPPRHRRPHHPRHAPYPPQSPRSPPSKAPLTSPPAPRPLSPSRASSSVTTREHRRRCAASTSRSRTRRSMPTH